MGLNELVRRRFPERAQNIDEFVELTRKANSNPVEAHVRRKVIKGAFSYTVGVIGDFEYSTRYNSADRTIIFDEMYEVGVLFHSERGFIDANKRDSMIGIVVLTAANRLNGLRASLPGVSTELFLGNRKIPDDILIAYEEIQRAAGRSFLTVKSDTR